MEFIVLTVGYFALLGGMLYKGADLPSILGAAGLYVSSYLGFRKSRVDITNKSGGQGKNGDKL